MSVMFAVVTTGCVPIVTACRMAEARMTSVMFATGTVLPA